MPRPTIALLLILITLLGALLPPLPLAAASEDTHNAAGLQVRASGGAVQIQWNAFPSDRVDAAVSLPRLAYAGYLLPMQLTPVRLDSGVQAAVELITLQSQPWSGQLDPAPQEMPPALDWEPIPSLLPRVDSTLPSAPVFVLRQGLIRDVSVAIVAFSQIYRDPVTGGLRTVEQLDARIPQAALVPALEELYTSVLASGAGVDAPAPQPSNPLASRRAVKLYAARVGIQHVPAGDLAAAGLPNANASRLRLFLRGIEVPLQILDSDGNGNLDAPGDAVRFYASQPSDRWNPEDVYWLIVDTRPGLRMADRAVVPNGAPTTGVALEFGRWSQSRLYESLFPGADGDHWFHFEAKTDPSMNGNPKQYPAFSLILDHRLPPAQGVSESALLTFTTTVYDDRDVAAGASDLVPHRLQLRSPAFDLTDTANDWVVDFSLGAVQNQTRTLSLPAPSTAMSVTLLPTDQPNAALFDGVEWQLPVRLQFGGQGAAFRGRAGTWTYNLSGLSPGASLYDITDPQRPQVLAQLELSAAAFLPFISGPSSSAAALASATTAASLLFQDGPAARHYLVTGAGTLFTPRSEAYRPVSFVLPGGADAVYITPAGFRTELQPLLAHRTAQGYHSIAVDVQDIYDAWSFGYVDPEAIRSFLRYAVTTWRPAPIAAILVGDGTRDPYDYSAYGSVNLIPPYLADVDPWLGEAPCESCYAQLDGDNPLSESAFFTDIWLGRFPAARPDELATIVAKIIAYETAKDRIVPWRSRTVQLADDYIRADGSYDPAGNFPAFVEGIISLQPSAIQTVRNYYNAPFDPANLSPDLAAFYRRIQPWIEGDSSSALHKSIDYLNLGAGLVTFTGHAHHWQWAVTDRSDPDGRLFGLWDVLNLTNRDRLFIGLSMTCYTSQFDVMAPFHYTLDENLVLYPDGGAVATWGPAGLSVSHGHDAIQQGFYNALWKAKPMQAKLGALVQAGYTYLITQRTCCQDIARTFVLLGDPLTPARVQPLDSLYVPALTRQSPSAGQ